MRGGVFDARHQVFRRFGARRFRRHQAEHDHFVVGYSLQWVKRAGALVVVFQQESIRFDAFKYRLCNQIVATFDQPTAALVAPSEVEAEGNIGVAAHDGVVHDQRCPGQSHILADFCRKNL